MLGVLATDIHLVLELSHYGGVIVFVGAIACAIVAYFSASPGETKEEKAGKAFVGGGIVTFLLVAGYQEGG
jgi:hypothetical protein